VKKMHMRRGIIWFKQMPQIPVCIIAGSGQVLMQFEPALGLSSNMWCQKVAKFNTKGLSRNL